MSSQSHTEAPSRLEYGSCDRPDTHARAAREHVAVLRAVGGELEAEEALFRVLLESFRDPEPPVIFPASPLHKTNFQFAVGKVLRAYKAQTRSPWGPKNDLGGK